jgi:hypothetical protein
MKRLALLWCIFLFGCGTLQTGSAPSVVFAGAPSAISVPFQASFPDTPQGRADFVATARFIGDEHYAKFVGSIATRHNRFVLGESAIRDVMSGVALAMVKVNPTISGAASLLSILTSSIGKSFRDAYYNGDEAFAVIARMNSERALIDSQINASLQGGAGLIELARLIAQRDRVGLAVGVKTR